MAKYLLSANRRCQESLIWIDRRLLHRKLYCAPFGVSIQPHSASPRWGCHWLHQAAMTAERLCCTLASPSVSGMTLPEILGSRRYFFQHCHRQTPAAIFKVETSHDRMQPTFFGSYKTVVVPFGCRVMSQLPCGHCLDKNGFFFRRHILRQLLRAFSKTTRLFLME